MVKQLFAGVIAKRSIPGLVSSRDELRLTQGLDSDSDSGLVSSRDELRLTAGLDSDSSQD